MTPHSETPPSNGIMIASFLFFVVALWGFTDVLTAAFGTLLIGIGYANHFTNDEH